MTIQPFKSFKKTHKLCVLSIHSVGHAVVKGNCRGNTEIIIDKENSGSPLPRRSAKRRKA